MKLSLNKLFTVWAVCLLFLLHPFYSYASDSFFVSKRTIQTATWHSLTKDTAYYYRNVVENVKIKAPREVKPNRFLTGLIHFLTSTTGKILIWSFIICVVLLVLYKIFIADKTAIFSRNIKALDNSDTSINEEDINSNWELQLQKAMKANNLRLAVRYSYLWLLQMLQKNELIQYRNDKTNYDYYRELAETGYKQPFQRLTRQYEYAWYGHIELTDASFAEYMNTFNVFKEKLS